MNKVRKLRDASEPNPLLPSEPDPVVTDDLIHAAARNDYPGKVFVIGGREFPIRDFEYDDHIAFMRSAKPLVMMVAEAYLSINDAGEAGFNWMGLLENHDGLMDVCEKDLPRMALLCCRQSDATMTEAELKKLARRPYELLDAVLVQIKHSQIVEEFARFFPQIVGRLMDLAPSAESPATLSTIGATPLSS